MGPGGSSSLGPTKQERDVASGAAPLQYIPHSLRTLATELVPGALRTLELEQRLQAEAAGAGRTSGGAPTMGEDDEAAGEGSDAAAAAWRAEIREMVERLVPEEDRWDEGDEGVAEGRGEAAEPASVGDALPPEACADSAATPGDMLDLDLDELLSALPWEFVISKDALSDWVALGGRMRQMVMAKLLKIGRGEWGVSGDTARLFFRDQRLDTLEVSRGAPVHVRSV
jgi:hypothetical protein